MLSQVRSRPTASCLCIRPTEAGHDIMLAWVGDSRVIEVDMMAGSSNLVYRTSMHQPDNDQERRRIEMQWKARQAMRDREADEATTPVENISAEFDGTPLVVKGRLVGGTPVVTKDDLLDAGLMDDGTVDLALAARGLEYEARLNAAPPAPSPAPGAHTRVGQYRPECATPWTGRTPRPVPSSV